MKAGILDSKRNIVNRLELTIYESELFIIKENSSLSAKTKFIFFLQYKLDENESTKSEKSVSGHMLSFFKRQVMDFFVGW